MRIIHHKGQLIAISVRSSNKANASAVEKVSKEQPVEDLQVEEQQVEEQQVEEQSEDTDASETVTLPNEFKAKAGGKNRPWGTRRFQVDSTSEENSYDERSLNGKILKQSYWALRTIFTLTDRSLSSSFAAGYNSWFFWRSFNVFDEHNKYLGQINKHWFTWFSGVHRYHIRNREGKILARAQVEDSGNFTEIVMRSADKSYRYNQVVAKFKLPRDYNAHLDSNNDYLSWNVKIEDKDQEFFSKDRLDPRILSMFIPFVSSRDYNWK